MDEEGIRTLIAQAESDPLAADGRRQLTLTLAAAFRAVGNALHLGGYIIGGDRVSGQSPFGFGSDAAVGLATILQIAGELMSGASELLDRHNVYAGSALIRQLVEVEYLAWAFGSDEEEAQRWLRSSATERRQMWQPRHLRERAGDRFRGIDYSYHCELGGHPTPSAVPLVAAGQTDQAAARWWFDLCAHGASTWDYGVLAIDQCGYSEHLPSPDVAEKVERVVEHWRAVDGMVDALIQIRLLNEAAAKAGNPTP